MFNKRKTDACLADEDGAVTVDWVVLTAALVGIAMAVILLLAPAISDRTAYIRDNTPGEKVTLPDPE